MEFGKSHSVSTQKKHIEENFIRTNLEWVAWRPGMERVWETPPLSHKFMRRSLGFLNSWWSPSVAGPSYSPRSAQWQSRPALGVQGPHLSWDSFLSANTAQVKEGLKYEKERFSPLRLAIPRSTRAVDRVTVFAQQDRQNALLMYRHAWTTKNGMFFHCLQGDKFWGWGLVPNTFLHLMHQQGSGWFTCKNRARVCAHSTSPPRQFAQTAP